MYSMLDKIDQHVQLNGMPYGQIIVSSSYFPKYFNKIASEYLNRAIDFGAKTGAIKEYVISYEGNNKIKLIAWANNGRDRIVIFPGDEPFDYSIIGKKVSEFGIIREAMLREKEDILQVKRLLEMKGLDDRYKIYGKPFEESLKDSAHLCNLYIDEWNKIYKEDVLGVDDFLMGRLHYCQPVTSTIIRSTVVNNGDGKKERTNVVLSVEERKKVLMSYGPLFGVCAYSRQSSDIEYLNYLYDVGDGKYLAIMEPYSGINLTKAIYFTADDGMDEVKFRRLVKDVLELPFDRVVKHKGVLTFHHSTIESFDNKVSIMVTGEAKDKSNSSLLKRISSAKKASCDVEK